MAAEDDILSFSRLGELTSLDLVMKEALRLIPPVPAIGRMALVDTELQGHYAPAGTAAMVAPLPVHYDPDLWTDPDAFDPQRFHEDRREDRSHPYAYLPFGGGAHKCIGMYFGQMEVKTILHQVLRRFRVTSPNDAEWNVNRDWDWTSLPKPLDDLPIVLTRL